MAGSGLVRSSVSALAWMPAIGVRSSWEASGQEPAHAFFGAAQGAGFDDREPADDDEKAQAGQASAEEDLPGRWRLWQKDG